MITPEPEKHLCETCRGQKAHVFVYIRSQKKFLNICMKCLNDELEGRFGSYLYRMDNKPEYEVTCPNCKCLFGVGQKKK